MWHGGQLALLMVQLAIWGQIASTPLEALLLPAVRQAWLRLDMRGPPEGA